MAEKCTNTSSPVERWINPYPFAPLNHFTVPFSLTDKTPFTNREELFLQVPGLRFDRLKPPSRNRQNLRLRFWSRGVTSKRKRLLDPPAAEPLAVGISESDNLARFHHTTNVNPTSGLTTGPLTGIEQKIISSIKTFRKRN